MKGFIKFLLISFTLIFVFSGIGSILVYKKLLQYKDTELDEYLIYSQTQNEKSQVYAYNFSDRYNREGKIENDPYAEFSDYQRYEKAEFQNIPSNLINAFIAVEDKNFYKHNGFDLLRTARATANYILKRGSGFGASTITQQLVKNLTGYDEITPERKITEIFYAIDLESRYTKDEILTMYLNIINLGSGCRGVAAASKYYFSKDLSELELIECASIAAITNNPSYYDPTKHPENNKKRRDIILLCMLEQGYIDNEQYREATERELDLNITDTKSNTVNSWYADMVFEDVLCDLCEKYSISRGAASNMLYSGGLKIYCAVDTDIQKILEDYYENTDNFKNLKDGLASSFILIDQRTGDILGVAGNIGKKDKNRIQSYATDTKRPSGSAIKPLSVYAPCFENGIINWSSIVEDSPIKIGNTDWPKNADGCYYGNVDIDFALKRSLNTVPIKLLDKLGLENSFDFLKEKLHFDSLTDADNSGTHDLCPSSLGLGQHEMGVTLKELTSAYGIFDHGEYIKPRSYYKVCDSNGRVILDNEKEREEVISRENAAIMTKLLEGVVDDGTARNSITLDKKVSVAGKTGTTQNNCDRYFIGYTPELLGGAWMGYEYPKPLSEYSRNPTLKIWDDIMCRIYELDKLESAKKEFTVPQNLINLSYDVTTGDAPNEYSKGENIRNGWFCE